MATSKPTDILTWYSDGITPHKELTTNGWVIGSKPAAQQLNALYSIVPQYNAFVSDRLFSSGASAQNLQIESGSVLLTSTRSTRIGAGVGTSSGGNIVIQPGTGGDVVVNDLLPRAGTIVIRGGVSRNTAEQQGNVIINAGQTSISTSNATGILVGEHDILLGARPGSASTLLFPGTDKYAQTLNSTSMTIVAKDIVTDAYLPTKTITFTTESTPYEVRDRLANQVDGITAEIVYGNILSLSSLTREFYISFNSLSTAQAFGFKTNYASPRKEDTYVTLDGMTCIGVLGRNTHTSSIQPGTLVAVRKPSGNSQLQPFVDTILNDSAPDISPILVSNKPQTTYVVDSFIGVILKVTINIETPSQAVTIYTTFPSGTYTAFQVVNAINAASGSQGVFNLASTFDGRTIQLNGKSSGINAPSITVHSEAEPPLSALYMSLAPNLFGFQIGNHYATTLQDTDFIGVAQRSIGADQFQQIEVGEQFLIAQQGICFAFVRNAPTVAGGTRLGLGQAVGRFVPLAVPSGTLQATSCSLYRTKAIALSHVTGDLMRVYLCSIGTSD